MGTSLQFEETDYYLSHLVSDDEIQQNEAFTLLSIQRNNYHREVDDVAFELVKTWAEIVADGARDGFHDTENSISGNFDSLILQS